MPFLPLRARASSTSEGGRRDHMLRQARLRHGRQVPWALIFQHRPSFQASAKFSSKAPTSVMKGSTLPTHDGEPCPPRSSLVTLRPSLSQSVWDSMLPPPP
jgi:hypothetical protein